MLARTRQPHRVAESDPDGLGEGDEGGRSLRPTPASWSPLSPVVPLPPGGRRAHSPRCRPSQARETRILLARKVLIFPAGEPVALNESLKFKAQAPKVTGAGLDRGRPRRDTPVIRRPGEREGTPLSRGGPTDRLHILPSTPWPCSRPKETDERTGSLKVHHEAQEVFASLLPPRCDIVVRATGPAVPADLGFVGLEARDGRGGPSGTDHAERALVNREQEEALAWTYFETCGETKGTRAKPTGVRSAQGPEGPRPATHQLRLQQKWFHVYYGVV